MKKEQLFSIVACMFYALALFQIADHGFNLLFAIYMGVGTVFMSLYTKYRKDIQ